MQSASAAEPTTTDWLVYANQGATRNDPLHVEQWTRSHIHYRPSTTGGNLSAGGAQRKLRLLGSGGSPNSETKSAPFRGPLALRPPLGPTHGDSQGGCDRTDVAGKNIGCECRPDRLAGQEDPQGSPRAHQHTHSQICDNHAVLLFSRLASGRSAAFSQAAESHSGVLAEPCQPGSNRSAVVCSQREQPEICGLLSR